MERDDSLEQALKKCAVGFDVGETVEEFAVQDGELKLVKRKVTKKAVPPDISAAKLLLESETPVAAWSDEQLAAEKERLLGLLRAEAK